MSSFCYLQLQLCCASTHQAFCFFSLFAYGLGLLLQVPTFAYLGHGASLVQLLSTDSVALDCMSGSLQGSAVAPLDQVLYCI